MLGLPSFEAAKGFSFKKTCSSIGKGCLSFISAIPDATVSFLYAIPGATKVASATGTILFNVNNFCKERGWGEIAEVALSVPIAFGTTVTSIVTRYLFMYRGIKKGFKSDPSDPTCMPCSCSPPSCSCSCSPGLSKKGRQYPTTAGFIALLAVMFVYSNFSALAGYIAGYAYNTLSQLLFGRSLNTECGTPQQSEPWKRYLLLGFAGLLAIFNKLSFNLFNWRKIIDYYKEFILKKKWKKIKAITWIESIFVTILNTVLVFFSSEKLVALFQKNSLCHWAATQISDKATFAFSFLSSLVNFIVTGIMTLAGIHKRRSKKEAQNREELLKHLPVFHFLDKLIQLSFILDGIGNGLGTHAALASITNRLINRDDLPVDVGLWLAIIPSLYMIKAQIALNYEAYMTILQDYMKAQGASDPHLAEPLMKQEKKEPSSPIPPPPPPETPKDTVIDIPTTTGAGSSPKKINEKLAGQGETKKAQESRATPVQFGKEPQKSSRVFQSPEYHATQAANAPVIAPKRSRRHKHRHG